MPEVHEFVGDHELRVGVTRFHYEYPLRDIPPGCLGIEKDRPLLEAYLDLWAGLRPRRVVELGMRCGGSTALMHELGGVDRIVSVELSNLRLEALDRYIADRGAQDVVRPHYGVDQADRQRLADIVADEFAGAPLDLVVDDASHLYPESRASFEVLFPHLRPGGLYLLEDWSWQHMTAAQLTAALDDDPQLSDLIAQRMVDENWTAPVPPMSRLVIELVIARAISGAVVADLAIGPVWAAVRRGDAVIEPGTFRLDDHAPDQLQLLRPIR